MYFTINDYSFEVYGDEGDYYWIHVDDSDIAVEDSHPFATKAECQQDAMAYAEKLTIEDAEAKEQAYLDKRYGTAVEQWRKDYRNSIEL